MIKKLFNKFLRKNKSAFKRLGEKYFKLKFFMSLDDGGYYRDVNCTKKYKNPKLKNAQRKRHITNRLKKELKQARRAA